MESAKEREILVLGKEDGGGVEVWAIRSESVGEPVVFRCRGYIDTYNSGRFSGAVAAAMAQGARKLVFDLAGVTYISSSGVGCFTEFLRETRSAGGDMFLVAVREKVWGVFELLGVAKFFNTAQSLEEALASLPSAKASAEVPFGPMQAITASFGRLEAFVERGKQRDFYDEVISVLRQIQCLHEAAATA